MEDVLEVYKRPYNPKRPMVCLDETSKQLIGETRTPVPAWPGQVAHYDYEYVRNGVANLFMICEPLAGQRDVEVTDRRTKKDYAQCLRKISDEMYPDAEVIVLVQDNLNTHSPASLYEAFGPAEAKRLCRNSSRNVPLFNSVEVSPCWVDVGRRNGGERSEAEWSRPTSAACARGGWLRAWRGPDDRPDAGPMWAWVPAGS